MSFRETNRQQREDEAQRLLLTQRRLVIIALIFVISYLATQVASVFSDILRIFAISLFIAYMMIGLVDRLERYTNSRINAVLAVYTACILATVAGGILVIPSLVHQISQFAQTMVDQLPHLLEWFGNALAPLERKLETANLHIRSTEILSKLASTMPQPDPSQLFSQVSGVAMGTMTWFFYGLSIMILVFYFLLDGSQMSKNIVSLFPPEQQPHLSEFVTETNRTLQAFFRGQIVLGFGFGVFMVFVYWGLGVQYALALGLLLGLWEIVPVIGPTIGFAPAVIAVLLQGMANVPETLPGGRLTQVLILFIAFNLVQWIKDNVIAPRYIGDVIGLHPVVIFLAIMIGARMDGMLGIIVSLPLACVVNVIFRQALRSARETRAVPAGVTIEPITPRGPKSSDDQLRSDEIVANEDED